ncbi:hypothetical protein EGR_00908 [Echinococcus granulosus]|uniref:Uncharacterized protein n=1 Tax=Echinococcus granulosus TaxID=6210 RepID=W6VBY6_ECHGR|nr:hypothetical protein EGR_00908 [Echinococcus granulosus]EUB64364.1 hypothetical protein EGR_00908 [Echinococcus granulosus]
MHKCDQREIPTCGSHCWHHYAAKFAIFHYPYETKAKELLWSTNSEYRLLADTTHRSKFLSGCSAVGSTPPAKEGVWVSTILKCAGSLDLAICLRELQRGVNRKRAKTCIKVFGTQVLKSNNDYTKVKSTVPLQLYSPDFCHLLNDIRYIRATGLYENANRFLWIMWTPTSSSTLTNSFAVTRFRLLNSYVSTHAKLPSEECFLHLFLHSKKGKSFSDPIERKKVEAESQFLTDLLETIRPKCSIQPVESHKLSIQGMEQENSCVPFQWEDLCKQWNVSIQEAPDGHQFLYDGRVSKMRERSAAVAEGSPQEGYCYSKAYPNSELKLDPNLIRNSSSPSSCGQYHRLARAKFRALK